MKERKPYEKPEVTRIVLRPEESVLAACKASAVIVDCEPQMMNVGS